MNLEQALTDYAAVMEKCPLLLGIPKEAYTEILACMEAGVHEAARGEIILSPGEPFRYSYYLLEGCLQGSFMNYAFDEITLNQFLPGALMGESFACIRDAVSPIQLKALSGSVYLSLRLTPLMDRTHPLQGSRQILLVNLMDTLAHQNVFLNRKVRILGQKSARDRIILYLESLPRTSDGFSMVPFSRTDLAEFLGLNRSAMSRELGRMEKEGLLEIRGRKLKLLHTL